MTIEKPKYEIRQRVWYFRNGAVSKCTIIGIKLHEEDIYEYLIVTDGPLDPTTITAYERDLYESKEDLLEEIKAYIELEDIE